MPSCQHNVRGSGGRARLRYTALVAGPILALASAGEAQSVRGTLTDPGGGSAVAGAVVLLMDSLDRPVARALSREHGEYLLVAPAAGTYRIRVLRIGYAPSMDGPFLLRSGETLPRPLTVSGSAIRLESVKVSATRQCLVRPDSSQAAFVVWEEARKALAATSITQASRPTVHLRRYDRRLDAAGLVVQHEEAREERGVSNRPFVSAPAETLFAHGFVRHDPGGTTYFAPDVDVLLSEKFADTHCFRLDTATASGEALVGVQFSPVADRDGRADISGTLWVERRSAELRTMSFHYTNQPGVKEGLAGGELEFLRLPNGAWTVGRWQIRMPVLLVRESGTLAAAGALEAPGRLERRRTTELAGVQATGGEVLDVGWQGRTVWSRRPRTLLVHLVDSATNAPLGPVEGSVEGLNRRIVTDGAGTVSIEGLTPGRYDVLFRLPLLDSLSLGPFRAQLLVGDSATTSAVVRAPSRSSAFALACGTNADLEANAVLVGTVVDGATENPVTNAVVHATWKAKFARLAGGYTYREEQRQVNTDSDGRFRICEVPRDTPLVISAEKGGQLGLPVSFRASGDSQLAELRLSLRRP